MQRSTVKQDPLQRVVLRSERPLLVVFWEFVRFTESHQLQGQEGQLRSQRVLVRLCSRPRFRNSRMGPDMRNPDTELKHPSARPPTLL